MGALGSVTAVLAPADDASQDGQCIDSSLFGARFKGLMGRIACRFGRVEPRRRAETEFTVAREWTSESPAEKHEEVRAGNWSPTPRQD